MYKDATLESKLYEIGLQAGFTSSGIPEAFEDSDAYIQGYDSGRRAFEHLKKENPFGPYGPTHDTLRPPPPSP